MNVDAGYTTAVEQPPGQSRRAQAILWLVVVLALAFSVLQKTSLETESPAHPFWFLDLLLLGLFAGGLLVRHFGLLSLPRWVESEKAPIIYVLLTWLVGMVYELSLRTGETGFGGMHPDTLTSFVMAQGFYIPFALGTLWVIRRRWLALPAVFWLGATVSWYEVMTTGIPGIFARPENFVLAPLVIGYYLGIYGILAALPLVFMDVEALWGESDRPYGWGTLIGHGFLLGLIAWAIFALWSLLVRFALTGWTLGV